MMDFTMYRLHQMAEDLEAKGTRIWLRDKNDKKVIYCSDGNYYCNVLNWDWTQEATRNLYTEYVRNATKEGGVDGVFADLHRVHALHVWCAVQEEDALDDLVGVFHLFDGFIVLPFSKYFVHWY